MRPGKEKRTSSFFFALGFHYICTQNDHAMKKRTILLSSILIAILLVLILAPIILKGKLVRLIRQELSTQWKAELVVGSAQASLFKHFPEVSLTFRRHPCPSRPCRSSLEPEIPHWQANSNPRPYFHPRRQPSH